MCVCTLVVVGIGAFAPVVTAIASQHWANQSVQTSHIRRESIVFANWLVFLVSKHTASHARSSHNIERSNLGMLACFILGSYFGADFAQLIVSLNTKTILNEFGIV